MKIQILDTSGKKKKEITTSLFKEPVREDIIRKVVEAERAWHAYSSRYRAGMDRSASGNTSKRRHSWKSDRGRGLPRLPRKIFWRRGTQFSWEPSIVPSTRGGRRAHPPKGSVPDKKINKKEYLKALMSSLSYVASAEELKKRYSRLKDKDINRPLPLIIEDSLLVYKTSDFNESIKKILGELYDVSVKKRSIRPGKGKSRGRKYKSTSGALFVIGNNEQLKVTGIEALNVNQLTVSDLALNGARLTLFTEQAISDLERIKQGKSKEKKDKK